MKKHNLNVLVFRRKMETRRSLGLFRVFMYLCICQGHLQGCLEKVPMTSKEAKFEWHVAPHNSEGCKHIFNKGPIVRCLMFAKKIVSNHINASHTVFSDPLSSASDLLTFIRSIIWGSRKIPSLILTLLICGNFCCRYWNAVLSSRLLTRLFVMPSLIRNSGKNVRFGCHNGLSRLKLPTFRPLV